MWIVAAVSSATDESVPPATNVHIPISVLLRTKTYKLLVYVKVASNYRTVPVNPVNGKRVIIIFTVPVRAVQLTTRSKLTTFPNVCLAARLCSISTRLSGSRPSNDRCKHPRLHFRATLRCFQKTAPYFQLCYGYSCNQMPKWVC